MSSIPRTTKDQFQPSLGCFPVDTVSGHRRAGIFVNPSVQIRSKEVRAMIVVDVFYNLEIPEIGFICPFCQTLQCRIGGRMIDTQMYPNPKDVVAEHLKGKDRCMKFNPDLDSAEELQASAVNVTL
jgi:hypothetical protein